MSEQLPAKLCGAKLRGKDATCKNTVVMANGRCRLHGGASTGRPLTHGRRSKFLPKGLKELYEALENDHELVNLEDDIRTVEADIQQTFQMMQEHAGACWKEARALFETEQTEKLSELFDRGLEMDGLQARYERLTMLKARLIAVESRRSAMQESNLNIREQNALIAVMISSVAEEPIEHVSNEARARIQAKLLRQMSSASS